MNSVSLSPGKSKNNFIWFILFVLGLILWVITLGENDAENWRAVLINFSFFTSVAAGLMIWPAIVTASNGTWSEPVDRIAYTGIAWGIPSIIFLILLWIGSPDWAVWVKEKVPQEFWLSNNFLFVRDLIFLGAFWIFSFWYLTKGRKKNLLLPSGILILLYAIVFSLLGFDLIMALDPHWYSSGFGLYFFISGLFAASAAWALFSILFADPDKENLHDLGKLIFAFSILNAYLMFAQFLPIWYENLPEETRFLVPRFNFMDWKAVSYFLLAVIYLGPIVLLLTEWAKKNKWYLGSVSFLILIGMWVERWWLVSADFSYQLNFTFADFSLLLAFTGLFMTGVIISLKFLPGKIIKHQEEN
jgi:hypothetical protein